MARSKKTSKSKSKSKEPAKAAETEVEPEAKAQGEGDDLATEAVELLERARAEAAEMLEEARAEAEAMKDNALAQARRELAELERAAMARVQAAAGDAAMSERVRVWVRARNRKPGWPPLHLAEARMHVPNVVTELEVEGWQRKLLMADEFVDCWDEEPDPSELVVEPSAPAEPEPEPQPRGRNKPVGDPFDRPPKRKRGE